MTRQGNVAPSRSSTRVANPVASGSASTETTDPATLEATQRTNSHDASDQTSESPFAGEIVRQIEATVETFRTGKVRKSQAIYKIGQLLASGPNGDEDIKSDSLDRYSVTLDGIEALAARANEHGQRVSCTVLGKRKEESGRGGGRHEEIDGDNPREPRDDEIDNFLEGIPKGIDGVEQECPDNGGSGDDSDPESDDDGGRHGRSNKKQRIYESQMPWFSKEQQVRKSVTHVSCNKTRKLLDLFQKDPVAVKRWIRCAASAPAGFPNTEWDALIKGETIDLDTIFSSLHHIHSIDESIGHVGTTEIQFGRPKPAAKIETSGQWTAAFNLVIKATSFLFPHRCEELRQYGDYIEELFSAKSVATHPRLFKYDEAVRYKVGQGQSVLLTDTGAFNRYYEAIVAPDGVGIASTSGGGIPNPKKGGKSGEGSDICHRFNGKNGCGNAADKCKYKHICKKCNKGGHGKLDCKVDKAV
jgi:hypothetical protein